MRNILTSLTALMMMVSTGFAQSQTPTSSQKTPAIATPDTSNPGAPVQGKNSFTESQARTRLEKAGYTDISYLQLDAQGVWRASAVKDAKPVQVSLDYQGNIVGK